MKVLTNALVIIILHYINMSNLHAVYFKLTQCYFLFENVWKVLLLLPLYPQFLVLSFSSFSSRLNQYFHQAVFPASPDKVISINYNSHKAPYTSAS